MEITWILHGISNYYKLISTIYYFIEKHVKNIRKSGGGNSKFQKFFLGEPKFQMTFFKKRDFCTEVIFTSKK